MQSARIVADSDGSGVAIEFSKENDFAFSAAQKPDVSTALDAALSNAFGGSVPFRFTQGGGVAAAVMAAARNVRPSGSGGPAETARSSAPRMPSRFDARGMASSSSAFPTASARMGGFGGEGASAPKAAVVANEGVAPASRAHANAPSAPASVRAESNPYDAPAFDRDDMVPYSDEDAASYVGEDSYADDSYAPASFEGDAHAAASSAVRPNDAGATPEGNRTSAVAPEGDRDADATMNGVGGYDFGVTGPAPVDPYPVGRSLGFDSMPPAKKRPKGTVSAKGWPGVGDASDADASLVRGKADSPDAKMGESGAESERRDDFPEGQTGSLPESSSSGPLHGDGGVPSSFVPFDPNTAIDPNKPNPFAGRKMPSGIGGGGGGASFPDSRPAHTAGDGDMGIADIFGAFGVSMDNVREE